MEQHKTCVVFSEARYAGACSEPPHAWEEEIAFTVVGEDARASGEMSMRWYRLDGQLAPRLEVSCDGWRVLAHMTPPLLVELAEVDNQDITPTYFRQVLERCGFVDTTLRV